MPGHLKYMLRPSINVYRVTMLPGAIMISMVFVHVAVGNEPIVPIGRYDAENWNNY